MKINLWLGVPKTLPHKSMLPDGHEPQVEKPLFYGIVVLFLMDPV